MKFLLALTAGLLGGASASAIKFMENDVLAAKGMASLAVHVAQNGYPAPEKCTLKNVAVRREWSVNIQHEASFSHLTMR